MNRKVKIGVTERGDAGIDLSWSEKLNKVDGAILITKNITDEFIDKVLYKYNRVNKIIVHCTCTGWGGTLFEPNVPSYKEQIMKLKTLINYGFPPSHCVLRIDPIFPTPAGLKRVGELLDFYIEKIPQHQLIRYRVSIYDEYKHVKERLRSIGVNPLYSGMYANCDQIQSVGSKLSSYPFMFETCAEDKLAQMFPSVFTVVGCVSYADFDILGIPKQDFAVNGQKRTGCHCMTCKTELLENKRRCPNGCLYCYWQD